jgi:hypothetical protein
MQLVKTVVSDSGTDAGRLMDHEGDLVLECHGFHYRFQSRADSLGTIHRLHWVEREDKPLIDVFRAADGIDIWHAYEIAGSVECSADFPVEASIQALWEIM